MYIFNCNFFKTVKYINFVIHFFNIDTGKDALDKLLKRLCSRYFLNNIIKKIPSFNS